jgi:hypothetical protein
MVKLSNKCLMKWHDTDAVECFCSRIEMNVELWDVSSKCSTRVSTRKMLEPT